MISGKGRKQGMRFWYFCKLEDTGEKNPSKMVNLYFEYRDWLETHFLYYEPSKFLSVICVPIGIQDVNVIQQN